MSRRVDAIISDSLHVHCRGPFTAVDLWVRAGSAVARAVGSLHKSERLRGLAGFLSRHLLYLMLRFGCFIQVELNCSKDFAVDRAVISLRALFENHVKIVIRNANSYLNHAAIVTAFDGNVNPQFSGVP
jgi:hypothetical protein